MDNKNDLQSLSYKLYHHLSNNVVGSEKVVKYRRYAYKCFDDLLRLGSDKIISSGSRAEGLDLHNSDIDFMHYLDCFVVDESFVNEEENGLLLDTDNALPGFALLKFPRKSDIIESGYTFVINTSTGLFLTNEFAKQEAFQFVSNVTLIKLCSKFCSNDVINIHGPAVSASIGLIDIDMVICLSCRKWPSVAKQWLHRIRSSKWPSFDLLTEIIYEDVLLVPVGSKTDSDEGSILEWRLSFSLVEKALVHSFNHCQLMCYALLKILLKEVIDEHIVVNKVLCSYYMKTVLFWVLDEVDRSYWTHANLLKCLSLCLNRLQYFILCNYIPNYFKPEHNMFSGKVSEEIRKHLEIFMSNLLKRNIWEVLMTSKSLSGLQNKMYYISKPLQVISDFDKTMLTTFLLDGAQLGLITKKKRSLYFFINRIQNGLCPKSLKNIYAMALLEFSQTYALSIRMPSIDSVSTYSSNKHYYSAYKKCVCHLLLNVNSDAMSGWLLLGAFFYSSQEYRKMTSLLHLSGEILSRDSNVLYSRWNLPSFQQIQCNKLLVRGGPFLKRLRHSFNRSLYVSSYVLGNDSFASHKDLVYSVFGFFIGTAKVFKRYLLFLNFYKQNNIEDMKSSLLLLQEVVDNHPTSDVWLVLLNHGLLFKALLLSGNMEAYYVDRMFAIVNSLDVPEFVKNSFEMFSNYILEMQNLALQNINHI